MAQKEKEKKPKENITRLKEKKFFCITCKEVSVMQHFDYKGKHYEKCKGCEKVRIVTAHVFDIACRCGKKIKAERVKKGNINNDATFACELSKFPGLPA